MGGERMSFKAPEKSYYSLNEVCNRWEIEYEHLLNIIFDQKKIRIGVTKKSLYKNGAILAKEITQETKETFINTLHHYFIHKGSSSLYDQHALDEININELSPSFFDLNFRKWVVSSIPSNELPEFFYIDIEHQSVLNQLENYSIFYDYDYERTVSSPPSIKEKYIYFFVGDENKKNYLLFKNDPTVPPSCDPIIYFDLSMAMIPSSEIKKIEAKSNGNNLRDQDNINLNSIQNPELRLALDAYIYFHKAGEEKNLLKSDISEWLTTESKKRGIKHIDQGKTITGLSDKKKDVISSLVKVSNPP